MQNSGANTTGIPGGRLAPTGSFVVLLRCLVALAFYASGGVASAQLNGGAPYTNLDAGDVFVATITQVDDQNATNARPPIVRFEVQEVIRGDQDVKRSPAVWLPRNHGIDYGDQDLLELQRWRTAPLKGPKVGERYILGGQGRERRLPKTDLTRYELFAFVRIRFDETARQRVIADLKQLKRQRAATALMQAAADRDRESRRDAWEAAFTAQQIKQLTQRADAVAIGRVVSGDTIEIEKMLKGRRRMSSGGSYFVQIHNREIDPRIEDIVVGERENALLFISEQNLVASVTSVSVDLIDPYLGVAPFKSEIVQVVQSTLKITPETKARPVLVVSALDRDIPTAVLRAARSRFVVISSHQFSSHGAHSIEHVRKTIPHAAYLLMIERKPNREIQLVPLQPLNSPPILRAIWGSDPSPVQIEKVIQAILVHDAD